MIFRLINNYIYIIYLITMKKIIIFALCLNLSLKLISQSLTKINTHSYYATELVNKRTAVLSKLGYEIKTILIKNDWINIEVPSNELINSNSDTLFAEAYVISTSPNYFTGASESGLSIKKVNRENGTKIEIIAIVETPTSVVIDNLKKHIDLFKTYFTFQKNKNISYKTSYIYDMSLINEDQPIAIGSSKPSKAVVLIIYSKEKK